MKLVDAALAALVFTVLLCACGNGGAPDASATPPADGPPKTFELVEATVDDIHAAFAGQQLLADGSRLTCVKLAQMYVDRIAVFDEAPQPSGGFPVGSVLRINPSALEQAAALDALYAAEGIGARPLHCVPMLVKDNFDTFDHPSTQGSLSMLGHQPSIDAHSVAGLRRAGALILGKANQDEFAITSAGYSGEGPLVRNPYNTLQSPGGSSSGTSAAIASSFAAAGAGTDTCQSIRYPASLNGVVGIRPSIGLVSQHGVFPASRARDAPGPIARTVRDAALVLSAMAGIDPRDPKTTEYLQRPITYVQFLDRNANGLRGRNLAFVTRFGNIDAVHPVLDPTDPTSPINSDPTGAFVNNGPPGEHQALVRAAIDEMRALGANVYEIEFPDFAFADATKPHFEWDDYFRNFEVENGHRAPRRCVSSLLHGSDRPCTGTDGIVESGLVAPVTLPFVLLVASADPNTAATPEDFQAHVDVRNYVQGLMDDFVTPDGAHVRLDALLLMPTTNPRTCDFGSSTQMPSMVVPVGFTSDGVPKGIEIMARKWDEPTMLGIAYDYEQATRWRRPPALQGSAR